MVTYKIKTIPHIVKPRGIHNIRGIINGKSEVYVKVGPVLCFLASRVEEHTVLVWDQASSFECDIEIAKRFLTIQKSYPGWQNTIEEYNKRNKTVSQISW